MKPEDNSLGTISEDTTSGLSLETLEPPPTPIQAPQPEPAQSLDPPSGQPFEPTLDPSLEPTPEPPLPGQTLEPTPEPSLDSTLGQPLESVPESSLDPTIGSTLEPTSEQSLEPLAPSPVVKTPAGSSQVGNFGPSKRLVPKFHYNKKAILITCITVAVIAAISVGGAFLTNLQSTKKTPLSNAQKIANYGVSTLALGRVGTNDQLQVGEADHLAVNGQLRVSNTLVLTPTAQPTAPTIGQIYYDQTTNTPYYYNGTQFISLSPQLVSSIDNASGALNLGSGLGLSGKTLLNNGVLSITGTTDQIITSGSTGNLTLSLPQSIGTGSTPSFAGLTVPTLSARPGDSGLIIGSNTQDLTLQGASTILSDSSGGFTSQLVFQTPTGNHTITIPDIGGTICTTSNNCASVRSYVSLQASSPGTPDVGSLNVTGTVGVGTLGSVGATGVCLNASNELATCIVNPTNVTLQSVYQASGTAPQITLNAVNGGITVADAATPIGGNLLAVTNNSGSTTYFSVTASGVTTSGTFTGNGSGLTNLSASNITTGTLNDARLSGNVTVQGNTFNGASQLVQLTNTGVLPVLSGINLTNLNASNLSSGTVPDARLSANVTIQGNTFNGASQLVQLTGGGILPVLSGANLTNLNASNISSGILAVARGGTGSGTAAGARSNLGAAVNGANNDITSLTALTTITPPSALTIGANAQNLTLQGAITSLTDNEGGFFSELNYITPTQNRVVSVPDASGIICVSSGNCFGAGGAGANVTLSNLTTVALNVDLISAADGFTNLGTSAKGFGKLYVADASNTYTFGFTGATTTGNKTITIPNISGSTATLCLDTGNCAGSGSSVTTSGGTINTIPLYTGAQQIGNSIISQDGGATTATVTGALSVTGIGTITGQLNANGGIVTNNTNINAGTGVITGNGSGLTTLNGSNISSGTVADARLSANVTLQGNTFNGASQLVQLTAGGILPVLSGLNLTNLNATNLTSGTVNDSRLSANVALLNGTQIFSGTNNFKPGVDSATAFRIQNAAGSTTLFNADTTGSGALTFGVPSTFSSTIAVNALGSAGATAICLNGSNQIATCSTNPGGVTLQQAYNASTSPDIVLSSGVGGLVIQDNATPIGGNLFAVQSNGGGTAYLGVTAGGISTSGTINSNTFTSSALAFGANSTATIDANAANAISIGGTSTGDILLGGGSGSTGCTVTNSNGNLTCTGNITGAATGTLGYWSRAGTTLQPATAGDAITTSGNISTSGSGTITAAGILNANAAGQTAISIADSGAQNSGLTIGGDTNLYRSAAGTLQTDSALVVSPTNNPVLALSVNPTINTSTVNARAIKANPTFTGTGDGPGGIAASAVFQPAANISVAYGFINIANGSPGAGINIGTLNAGYNRIDTGSGGGTVTTANSLMIAPPNLGSTKPGTINGINVFNQGSAGVGTAVGLEVAAQSGATTNIGVQIQASSTYSLQLAGTAGTASNGIEFGTDTNLYRSAASVLKTDSAFIAGGTASTNSATEFQVQNAAGTAALNVNTSTLTTTVQAGTDTTTLGSNLITCTDFTNVNSPCTGSQWTTTGWTAATTTATHNTGNTSALSTNEVTPVNGSTYLVSFTVSGVPAVNSTLTSVTFGGQTLGPYAINGNSSGFSESKIITASSNSGFLTFTTSSSFNGVISAVSIQLVTQAPNAVLVVKNASSTANIEVRASSSTTNTFVGLSAGSSNTTGIQNTILGTQALQNNTTGSSNSALGYQALQANTVGAQNTAVGRQALTANTVGVQNTAVGSLTLSANTTGQNNTALGYSALAANTNGVQNTALGSQTLQSLTTGTNNTAVGFNALNLLTTGGQDIALGTRALLNATGSSNTAIGYQAGYTNTAGNAVTTGTGNTFLGFSAGPGQSAYQVSNSTGLGLESTVNQSNAIILGCTNGVNSCPATSTVGIGSQYAPNALTVSPGTYGTNGTAGAATTITQTTTAITGSGTTFTSAMTGGTIYYNDGTTATVTFVSATALTSSVSKTVAGGSTYTIVYGGFNVTGTGTAYLQPTADSTTAFQIQNASGAQLFGIDSSNSIISIAGNNSGAVGAWTKQTGATGIVRQQHASVVANGYMYVLGGLTGTGGSTMSSVQYAPVTSSGAAGSWTTASQSLPVAIDDAAAVTANGYVYMMGGYNGTSTQSAVYYAKLNADGSTGAWTTSSNPLPANRANPTAVVVNGYVYLMGGGTSDQNGTTAQSTVYYAKLNADGSTGAWTTSANPLTTAVVMSTAATANGYIYSFGGNSTSTTITTVYYAKVNSDGSTGTWTTSSNSLPVTLRLGNAVVINGYAYYIGGYNGAAGSNFIYYAKLNADGSIGTWTTNAINSSNKWFDTVVTWDGYLYDLDGGFANADVYYASTERLQVGGSLDLVGATGQGSNSDGSGGALTAGNTNVLGTLNVSDQASFLNGVTVNGPLNVGGSVAFKPITDSTTEFQVQNANGNSLLAADTSNMQLNVGNLQSTGTLSVKGPDGGSILIGAVANSSVGSTAMTFSGNEITDTVRATDLQGDGRQPPDSSTGVWESTTNLVRNGGFESNTTDWLASNGAGSNGALSLNSQSAKFGSKSLQYSVTTRTGGNFAILVNQYYTYNSAPYFNTSTPYTLSFWAKETSGAAANISTGIMDSSAINTVMPLTATALTPNWTHYSYTFTPLQTGNQPDIYFYASVVPLPFTFLVDGVQIEQQPINTPYVNTNGSAVTRNAAKVTAPVSSITPTQGWVAMRTRQGYGTSIASSATNKTFFDLSDGTANNLVSAEYLPASGNIEISSVNGGTSSLATLSGASWNAGSSNTFIFAWTSTTELVSINGGTFTTIAASRPNIPGSVNQFEIGSNVGASQADSDILWTAAGTGTLTSSDAASINGFGNSDPSVTGINTIDAAASPSFVWNGENAAYSGTNNTPTLQSGITLDDASLYRSAADTLSSNASLILQPTANSTSAFQIQNAAGATLLNEDSTNTKLTVGQGNLVVTGLGTPATPGIAAGSNQGGTLSGAAGTTYYYKVTAINAAGETLPSSEVNINGAGFTPLTAPTAPTVAINASAGNLNGNYLYKVTFVTANGETTGGTTSATVSPASQQVDLSAIPTGPTGTTARKIYRTLAGGADNTQQLVTTINDNTTTTYTDNIADGSLGAALPGSNTATTNLNNATITFTPITGATSYRIYRGTSSNGESAYQTTSTSPFTDTGAAGTGSSTPVSDATGRIGIGTATPSANLHVAGTSLFQTPVNTATAFRILDSGGTNLLTADTTTDTVSVNNLTVTGTCTGCGVAGTVSLQSAYTTGSTITTTNANNITFNLAATGTPSKFIVQNPAGTNNSDNIFSLSGVYNANNLVTNGSFEQNTTGWAATSNVAISQDATQSAPYGSSDLKIVSSGPPVALNGAKYTVNMTNNTVYSMSFYAKTAAAFATMTEGFTSDGTTMVTTGCSLVQTPSTTTWLRFACTFTYLGGTNNGTSGIFIGQNDTTARTWYVDGVSLEQVATNSFYKEGTLNLNGLALGNTLIQPAANSNQAFQVANTAGTVGLVVDTNSNAITSNFAATFGSTLAVTSTATFSGTGIFNAASTTEFRVRNSNTAATLINGDTSTINNISTNGGVENGVTGYAANGAHATTTQDATAGNAYMGLDSLKTVTTSSVTANEGSKYTTTTALFPINSNPGYTLSFYAKLPAGSAAFTTLVAGRAEDGSTNTTCTLNSTTVTTYWQRFSCHFTTSVSSGTPYIFFGQSDAGVAHTYFIDSVQLISAAAAKDYGEGLLQFNGPITSPTIFQNQSDSTTAFQVQNAGLTTTLLNADTANTKVSVTGQLAVTGGINTAGLAVPAAPTVTPTLGSATSYSYTISALNANSGSTLASSAGTTSTGAATLDSTHFNTVTWAAVAGASSYNIYRTASGGTPSSTGLVGNVLATSALSFVDNGIAGGAAAGTIDNSGQLVATGTVLFKNAANSTAAFQVQNAAGSTTVLGIDTTNGRVGVGTAAPGNLLSIGALTTAAAGYQIAVTTGAGTNSGIVVQTVAGQSSGNILQAQDSTGAALATLDYLGNLTVKAATITGILTVNGHIVTGNTSGSTSAGVNANAGTSATCNVSGNDTSGQITLVTGSAAWASGAQCAINFSSSFGSAPHPVMTSANSTLTAAVHPYVTSATGSFTINFTSADTGANTYVWNYFNAQ